MKNDFQTYRNMTEDRLQSMCYQWFHGTFPELRGLLCYNLNNSRNKVRAMMDKGMGLQPGRSDMVFYYNRTAYHIEFKLPEGRQTEVQKKWQKTIEEAGYKYYIIRSEQEFKKLIRVIIGY